MDTLTVNNAEIADKKGASKWKNFAMATARAIANPVFIVLRLGFKMDVFIVFLSILFYIS